MDVDEPLMKEWLIRDNKLGTEYTVIPTSIRGNELTDRQMMSLLNK